MLHIANYSEFEFYLPNEHFDETIASKIGSFLPFDPCRAKKLTSDLFFNNYERYVVDRSNYNYFSESLQEEFVSMVLNNIEATFEFDPCTNYLVTPRLPVQDVTRQQYEMIILGPIPT